MVYPAFVEACPSCKQPRPPEDRRPADPYAPPAPVKVVPSLPVNDADYAKDPEWVQGHAVVVEETPAPSECKWCGKPPGFGGPCNGDFLVAPQETDAPQETTPPPPPDLWAMVSAQAQKELDASVLGDLLATADAPTETTGCMIPPALTEEFPEPAVKAKKARCPGPGCRKNARENSPYCSKICSDRCGRVRRKAASGAVLDKAESENLTRIEKALENWGKR